jgi:hypothetical protein
MDTVEVRMEPIKHMCTPLIDPAGIPYMNELEATAPGASIHVSEQTSVISPPTSITEHQSLLSPILKKSMEAPSIAQPTSAYMPRKSSYPYKADAKLKDVTVHGIRDVDRVLKKARRLKRRVKLLCEITRKDNRLMLSVAPKILSQEDPLNNVTNGDMGLKFNFRKSKQIFVSAEFQGPEQTAQAVLNDIVKIYRIPYAC